MSKFDPAEVLKGSIADITGKFGDHDDAQLKALHDFEGGRDGQKRTGMLSAIDSELSSRALTAKETAAIEAAGKDGVKLFRQADLDAARADNPDRQAIEAEHKNALKNALESVRTQHAEELETARREASEGFEQRMTDMQAEHAEAAKGFEQRIAALEGDLKKARGRQPAKAVAAKPRQLAITGEASFDESMRIAFTDSQDTTIQGLPELEFTAGDFELDRATQGRVLTQPINFPESVSRTEVKKVWLVDGDGKAAAVAELVNALPVGGGSTSSIPAKFLAFRKPEPAPAPEAAAA